MSANPIENNATPKNTGSLEELFRHHLGEEAAVPPRAMLWDQIDNSLLIKQNESYRRRLAATRWVAAASLLLATLAGTGWWAGRTGLVGRPELATTTATRPAPTGAARNGSVGRPGFGTTDSAGASGSDAVAIGTVASAASATQYSESQSNNQLQNAGSQRATARRNVVAVNGESGPASASLAVSSVRRTEGVGQDLNEAANATYAAAGRLRRNGATGRAAALATGNQAVATAASAANETIAANNAAAANDAALTQATGVAAGQRVQLPGSVSEIAGNTTGAAGAVALGGTTTAAGTAATLATGGAGAAATAAPLTASVSAAAVAAAPAGSLGTEAVGLLAARTVALNAVETPAPVLPGALAAGPEPTELALGTHRWQYGASYTASAFNPNINFSRAGIEPEFGYNPVLGPAELSEQAATEYRQNLRAGLSQRLALTVARRLRGH